MTLHIHVHRRHSTAQQARQDLAEAARTVAGPQRLALLRKWTSLLKPAGAIVLLLEGACHKQQNLRHDMLLAALVVY
jgi:hypothetical protein